MTVAGLIEKLQELDPTLPVWGDCGDPYDTFLVMDVSVTADEVWITA